MSDAAESRSSEVIRLTVKNFIGITYDMQQKLPRRRVYEVHGVVIDRDCEEIVFPIDIITAAAPELALGVVADKAQWLKGWGRRFRLFEVPCRRETARPWRDAEMRFICDIDLGADA